MAEPPRASYPHPPPSSWLPSPSTRFDHLVDHLAQQTPPHRHASDTLQQACREAVADPAAHEQVTKDHPVMLWLFPRLLTTFFDSPDFLRR